MQIARGFVAPFRGALFVSRHNLWTFVAVPLVLDLAAALAVGWWGGESLSAWALARLESGWLASTLTGLIGFAAAVCTFLLLQPVLSAPFVDLLCERTEKIHRGHAPSAGVLRSVAMAISHGVLKLVLYAFALAVTLVAGSLTGLGGFLGAVLYAVFVAYDAFDYPLARRAVSFSGKWRYLLSRPGQTVGYCCGAGLFYFVPLAGLLVPSFAAVGATLLFLDEGETSEGRSDPRIAQDRESARQSAWRRGSDSTWPQSDTKTDTKTEKGEMLR
jgi:uncharacterized protein involved in cysteine biosynthesis